MIGLDIDDDLTVAWAIADSKVDLLGLSVASGNAPLFATCPNAKILRNTLKPDLPIGCGLSKNLIAVDFKDEGQKESDAVKLLAQSVETQNVTFVAIGALTNIAAVFYHHPNILNKVKEIVIMGGSVKGDWELNFWSDKDAADYVLSLDIRKTVVTIEPCLDVHVTKQNAKSLGKWHSGKWIDQISGILYSVYAK